MLKELLIQNLALAENLSVSFQKGLNVITGETGAGKSLLVDALCLLSGAKVDIGLIRTGYQSAQVTGIFVPPNGKKKSFIFSVLKELGIPLFIDFPHEIIIKRYIQRNGKHRSTVNENPVSSKVLQLIARELIDMSSQFENQKLLDAETHSSFLDEYSQSTFIYKNFLDEYKKSKNDLKKIHQMIIDQHFLKREKSLYEFELQQIIEANFSCQEFLQLEQIITIGQKSNQAKQICADIFFHLSMGELNCFNILQNCKKHLEKLRKISGNINLPATAEHLDSILALLGEFEINVQQCAEYFEIDDSAFNLALQRIEIYNKILQKFGPTCEDVLVYQKKCEEFLEKEKNMQQELSSLILNCENQISKTLDLAKKLTEMRTKNLESISKKIKAELNELGMPNATFICQLNKNQYDPHTLEKKDFDKINIKNLKEFFSLSKFGNEKAQFLFSTNIGLEIQPIEKIASGGELSRIMLAIKNILLSDDNSISVFVFDEIDTGISGNIAAKVGKKLSDFCKKRADQEDRQVLCITHLPQVACHAHNHFIVSKETQTNKTITKIKRANEKEKLLEIALLLSGEHLSQESVAQAKVLLKSSNSL
jgi:DNA repair protein RecN (Recombination protein N)